MHGALVHASESDPAGLRHRRRVAAHDRGRLPSLLDQIHAGGSPAERLESQGA